VPEPSSHHIQTASRRWQPASSVSPRQAVEGTAVAVLGLLATAAWAAAPVAAQGVTGAAIGGRVLSVDSTPLEQANVHVVNASNGERWRTTTTARGRYFIEYLSIGGPCQIEVRAVGYVLGVRAVGLWGSRRLMANERNIEALTEVLLEALPQPNVAPALLASLPSSLIDDELVACEVDQESREFPMERAEVVASIRERLERIARGEV
jgi:hypothetical protein